MASKYSITTSDNPYNPFTQFDDWFAFDEQMGYHTCSYLARLTLTSPDFLQHDEDRAVEQAIDSIVRLNLTGNYEKVTIDDYK